MDYLWTPWRYRYMEAAGKDDGRCIFCAALEAGDDQETGILARGESTFIILNKFPYTAGHVMVSPYAHVGDYQRCEAATLTEMMRQAQRAQAALEAVYHPQGYNLGMNLGRAAGAGVTGHLHLHVLPRWSGDANFMTTIAETRVVPEELPTTYAKLRAALRS